MSALLIVDAANVVGSVPNGWWKDRAGATERLRDALRPVAESGLPDAAPELAAPVEVVLVVEGAAKDVQAVPGVGVVSAPASGDDTIVEILRDAANDRVRAVVTADRALRARVEELGGLVVGPRTLPHLRRPPVSNPVNAT
jgi:hypothetical protein